MAYRSVTKQLPTQFRARRDLLRKLGYKFKVDQFHAYVSIDTYTVCDEEMNLDHTLAQRYADAWLIALTRAEAHHEFSWRKAA